MGGEGGREEGEVEEKGGGRSGGEGKEGKGEGEGGRRVKEEGGDWY